MERDEKIRDSGIYILLSKRDRLISEPLIREHLKNVVTLEKRHAIRQAFIDEFRKKDFDGGLERGVAEIERTLEGVSVGNRRVGPGRALPVPVGPGAHRGAAGGGGGMMYTFLLIGLGIFAVLIILRLLGGLFGRSQGGYPNQMGMGGPRPGMGPGGPGYYGGGGGYGGGRGGGFFSGLLGGLGGAMAGNWLYDQFSGRHGGMTSAGAGLSGEDAATNVPDAADERIIGADDDAGQAASWDNGGGDTGGGDWGGGDAGGGGDWGGGGGDWGGGDAGGDWGGGGGGGDW